HWANKNFVNNELVKFDLFRRYGLIAAAGDRHLSEFCPGRWYLENPETVEKFGFALTKVIYRVKELEERLEKTKKLVSGEEKFELEETGEEGVHQICALMGLDSFVTNVNVPNYGQIPNLPRGAVVETNAFFGSDTVRPVFAGEMDERVLALVLRHVVNQETVVKAGLAGDYEYAFSAFLNDPNMPLSLKDARSLYNEMLENTKQYLPDYEKYKRAGH
ncbi:MAG: alpha-glucosidase/alpha-galactosidase, partial [Candidatus Scatosoma sp.]